MRVNADQFDNLTAHGSYDNEQYFELVNEMMDYCATAGMFTKLRLALTNIADYKVGEGWLSQERVAQFCRPYF